MDKLLIHTSGSGGLVFETLMHFCRFILIADIMGGFDMRGNRHHIFRSLSLSIWIWLYGTLCFTSQLLGPNILRYEMLHNIEKLS